MEPDVTTSAITLTEAQQSILSALLDTVLPASEDGTKPSAREIDFPAYLGEQAPAFHDTLVQVLGQLGGDFPSLALSQRVDQVQELEARDAKTFKALVFHIYDSYYQDHRVRHALGTIPGMPFPDGHSIVAGDLSSLEAVKARGKGYRR